MLNLAPSFDTVGWLAADSSVLRAAGSVLLPPLPPASRSPASPFTAHPPRRLMSIGMPNDQVRHLSGTLGASPDDGPVPGLGDIDALVMAFRTVQAAEAWQLHGRWIAANPGALHADVEARFRAGADIDPGTRRRAWEVIGGYRARTLDALGDDTWLVLPAAAGPGHARDASRAERDAWRQATLRHTVVASAFGLPSCVIPGTERPPAGTALVGPPGADHALLEAVTYADGTRR